MGTDFWKFTVVNMVILLAGLSVYWLVWGWAVGSLDFTDLQAATTSMIYAIQTWLGWPVEMQSATVLHYSSPAPGFGVEIITLCLGLGEMLFFAFLVLLFRGPNWRHKATGLAIFLPLIFIANTIRLLALYPLAEWLGIQAMWDVHWHIWKWGMFAVLMLFFAAWYMLTARRDIEKSISGKKVK